VTVAMPAAGVESATGTTEEHAVTSVQRRRHATTVPFPIAPTSCALRRGTGTRAIRKSTDLKQL